MTAKITAQYANENKINGEDLAALAGAEFDGVACGPDGVSYLRFLNVDQAALDTALASYEGSQAHQDFIAADAQKSAQDKLRNSDPDMARVTEDVNTRLEALLDLLETKGIITARERPALAQAAQDKIAAREAARADL